MLFIITLFVVTIGYALRYKFYRITYYHHPNLMISEEQKLLILSKPLYYSIPRGIYEIMLLSLLTICFFIYTFYFIPIYNLTTAENERQLKLLGILIICIFLQTLRILQILSYKIVISTETLYIKTLFSEKSIPLSTIDSIDQVAFHYMLSTTGHFYPIYIPVGYDKGYVLYRLLEDTVDRNSLKFKNTTKK